MGLNMYLNRKTYISDYGFGDAASPRSQLQISGPGTEHIKASRVPEITEEMGYWRKSNQIHAWFVENVQDGEDDCQPHRVSREQLQELMGIVDSILVAYGEGDLAAGTEKAEELLPTIGGFFFGSTDYNEWYFNDLKHTKAILEMCLADDETDTEQRGDFYYQSSW